MKIVILIALAYLALVLLQLVCYGIAVCVLHFLKEEYKLKPKDALVESLRLGGFYYKDKEQAK